MMEVPSSDAIYVGPTCHVQTAEKRFGPEVLDDIKAFVNENHGVVNNFDAGFDDDSDDEIVNPGPGGAQMAFLLGAGIAPEGWEHFSDDVPSSHADQDGDHGFPKLARCRGNLTTLSQRYNLYFTAYQDKIHVYQPQKAPQILPPPSLILQPPQSREGKYTGGHIDRNFGHQVNHLITGELGYLEILLMCYDDGDVVAYYTHPIALAVENGGISPCGTYIPSPPHMAMVKPFLHANVGYSAWGLAIHKDSRLLAVSCNKHDVTVFAFATRVGGMELDLGPGFSFGNQEPPKLWSGQTAMELEKHFQSRTRTWRIVLPLGPRGNNIPTVSFIDDGDGNAERILAADISGNTWIINIWQIGGFPAVHHPSTNRGGDQRYTGWGVMMLPDSSFRPARSNIAAMGLPPKDILETDRAAGERDRPEIWLDTTCSLHYVKDNAADPRVFLRARHGATYFVKHSRTLGANLPQQTLQDEEDQPFSDESDWLDDDDDSEALDQHDFYEQAKNPGANNPWRALSIGLGPEGSIIDLPQEDLQGFRLARTIVPTLGQTPPLFGFKDFLQFMGGSVIRQGLINTVDFRRARFPSYLTRNFSLLRTTNSSVELQSLDPHSASVMCKDVIVAHNRTVNIPWDLNSPISERISMLHHVPELSLVIMGSLCGRVALVSLTKPPSRVHGVRARRAFRVECVLPRGSEDRLRPFATLHGIAVSPVHDYRAAALRLRRPGPRTSQYRLILHYMDHTILMYDISRRSPDEDLMIF